MLPVIARLAAALPGAASRIAAVAPALALRLGIPVAKVSVNSLVNLVKSNKVAAAFVAYEVFGAGSEFLMELRDADAELAKIVETLGFTPDLVEDTSNVRDISKFTEEFGVIRDAADALGGLDRLVAVKKALSLSNDTYELFMTTREMIPFVR